MSLKIITGCMFSGKTTEIFKILSTIVSKDVLLINSNLDSRYDKNKIISQDNQKIDCLSLSKLSDVPIDLYTKCDYIIIDEAQNLSVHELKTIITRVGENTKIVLTGDIEQIDNTYVDAVSNGLTYAVEKFKNEPIAGHITMIKGQRSELATLASKIL